MAFWISLYHLDISELYLNIIRGISYGSYHLTCYCYYCYFIKWRFWIQLVPRFWPRIYGFFNTTHRHSNNTTYHHSNATSKSLLGWQWRLHAIATPLLPLQCHSLYNPMQPQSICGLLICIFTTHSCAIPVPLQYQFIQSEWPFSVHSGLWKYYTPKTLYCISFRVRDTSWRHLDIETFSALQAFFSETIVIPGRYCICVCSLLSGVMSHALVEW